MTGVSPKSYLNKTHLIQNLNVREVHQPYVSLLPGWELLNHSATLESKGMGPPLCLPVRAWIQADG